MGSYKLTDEELIELAQKEYEDSGEESFDVAYYQERFNITSGSYRIYLVMLYEHYRKWSIQPVSYLLFCDIIKVDRKANSCIFINREVCSLELGIIVGSYVRKRKKENKEKRLRQISGSKSKIERKDES